MGTRREDRRGTLILCDRRDALRRLLRRTDRPIRFLRLCHSAESARMVDALRAMPDAGNALRTFAPAAAGLAAYLLLARFATPDLLRKTLTRAG